MTEHEKPRSHCFSSFLLGGVLGALAGIFFTLKAGKVLRSDIRGNGSEVVKGAKEIYADASTREKRSSRRQSIKRRS